MTLSLSSQNVIKSTLLDCHRDNVFLAHFRDHYIFQPAPFPFHALSIRSLSNSSQLFRSFTIRKNTRTDLLERSLTQSVFELFTISLFSFPGFQETERFSGSGPDRVREHGEARESESYLRRLRSASVV